MKVKKDLRETEEAQDERKNGKTGGNSVRGFAMLTVCAVLAMVISLGTRVFTESGSGNKVYAASDAKTAYSEKWLCLPELPEWFPGSRIHHLQEAR